MFSTGGDDDFDVVLLEFAGDLVGDDEFPVPVITGVDGWPALGVLCVLNTCARKEPTDERIKVVTSSQQ